MTKPIHPIKAQTWVAFKEGEEKKEHHNPQINWTKIFHQKKPQQIHKKCPITPASSSAHSYGSLTGHLHLLTTCHIQAIYIRHERILQPINIDSNKT